MDAPLLVFAAVLFSFALVAGRLSAWSVTAPIAFVAAGALLSGAIDVDSVESGEAVKVLAEATLVLLLFHDAAQVKPRQIGRESGLIGRLLGIGLPLTMLLGYLLARGLFDELGWAFALLLAAALAPTDAGLGAATVLNPVVPVRIRRVLNVESGVNDGLATPVVLFAIAVIAGEEGLTARASLAEAVVSVLLGAGVGILAGVLAGRALTISRRAGWSTVASRPIAFLILPPVVYVIANELGGNGFIAAFLAGTAAAAAASWAGEREPAMELTETAADLLGYGVWFIFGLAAVPLITTVPAAGVVFAVAALTVLRMLPVALSLVGSGLRARSIAFIGWFGPRGLASIVFALIALEDLQRDSQLELVVSVISLTVLLSVVAHGLTAGPWARGYGAWVDREQPAAETTTAVEPQGRRGLGRPSASTDAR